MKIKVFFLFLFAISMQLSAENSLKPWESGAFETGKYRNLFVELGYSESEVDNKLQEIFVSLFEGPDKVYFEVGDSMAYVSDIKNNDVRSEGMSYGMMTAVQLDKKEMFDRLWRWSKHFMQHQEGAMKGYFRWSCKIDGTPNSQGPASDGELFFITSLIFASNRWGNDTGIDYLSEAQFILNSSFEKTDGDRVTPLIHPEHKLITFVPTGFGSNFTDPSYHIPAFYEVWARWADDGRAEYWRECAKKSREFLQKAIHPETGLNPDYSNYDGSLLNSDRIIGDAFRFDSWRVPLNITIDYTWSAKDKEWQQDYGKTFQNFLYSQGIDTYVDQYNVDGSDVTEILGAGGFTALRHSLGLVSTSAAVSLVSTHDKKDDFVHKLWNAKHEPYEDGYFDAYFDGFLRLFSFMALSGNYKIITPKEEVHLYISFGQSNMEGSARIEAIDTLDISNRFLVMQAVDCPDLGRELGQWYKAVPPLVRCHTGLTPTDYFGRSLLETLPEHVKVGVINVSVGGCKIELFEKDNFEAYVETSPDWLKNMVKEYDGNPYQRLVDLANKATSEGAIIKGILIHQGESNTGDKDWPIKVKNVYDNILKDVGMQPNSVPLLAGEVVHEEQNGVCASMNEIINELPKYIPSAYVISSRGCGVARDNLHFSAEGYRTLGKRYAEQMIALIHKANKWNN